MNRSSSLRVVDIGRQSGYDGNWTDLGKTVALSQNRSKAHYNTLQKMATKVQSGHWSVTPRSIWNPVSKATVASQDIEERCKRFTEGMAEDRQPHPKPNGEVITEATFQPGHYLTDTLAIQGTTEGSLAPGCPRDSHDLNQRMQGTADHGQVVKCHQCGQTVYHTEMLELPQRKVAFHKRCFRCVQCGLKLTFKTFVVNQKEPSDRKVYCQVHAPRLDAAKMDATAKLISECTQVPKVAIYNGLIRGPDAGKAIKYDSDALMIQAALNAPRPMTTRKSTPRPPPPDVVKSDIIGLRYF